MIKRPRGRVLQGRKTGGGGEMGPLLYEPVKKNSRKDGKKRECAETKRGHRFKRGD